MMQKSIELQQVLQATPCSWVLRCLRLFGQAGLVLLGLQTMVETAAYSATSLAGTSFFSFTLRGGRFLCIITIPFLLSAGIWTLATRLPSSFFCDKGHPNPADLFLYFPRITTFPPATAPVCSSFCSPVLAF